MILIGVLAEIIECGSCCYFLIFDCDCICNCISGAVCTLLGGVLDGFAARLMQLQMQSQSTLHPFLFFCIKSYKFVQMFWCFGK